MKTANVAEAVKSEHAVALLKQMYGENRVEENAARYQLVADGFPIYYQCKSSSKI